MNDILENIDRKINQIEATLFFQKVELNSNYSTNIINTQKVLNDMYNDRIKYKDKLRHLLKKKKRSYLTRKRGNLLIRMIWMLLRTWRNCIF